MASQSKVLLGNMVCQGTHPGDFCILDGTLERAIPKLSNRLVEFDRDDK